MADMSCRYKSVMAFGVITLLLGVIVLACGIVTIINQSVVSGIYAGIWGGLILITIGALGAFGGTCKNRGLIIAFMVVCILFCVIICGSLSWWSFLGMAADKFFVHNDRIKEGKVTEAHCKEEINALGSGFSVPEAPSGGGYTFCPNSNNGAFVANVLILVSSSLMFLFAILGAAFSCCAVCSCCGATNDRAVNPNEAHYG